MVKITGSQIELQSSDESPYIDLFTQTDKILRIDGSFLEQANGVNESVQYNDNGILTGDTEFLYNYATTTLSVPSIKIEDAYGTVMTDTLGYNQLTSSQTLTTSLTTVVRAMGTDVNISRSSNYISLACPWYIFGASKGGMTIFNETAGVFNEYSSILTWGTFSLDAECNYCSINEDGTICTVSDLDTVDSTTPYKRIGSTWSILDDDFSGVRGSKLSGNLSGCYMLGYNAFSQFSIHYFDGTNWNLQQSLFTGGTLSDFPLALSGTDTAIFSDGNAVRVYTRVITTWSLIHTFVIASVVSLDYYNGVLVIVYGNNVAIYENFVLITTLSITNARYSTTNGTYIFVNDTSNNIYIISKNDLGAWVFSTNTTTYTGAKKMSCNQDYLCIGAPTVGTYGQAIVYKIEDYVNEALASNEIILDDSTNLLIKSNYGTVSVSSSSLLLSNSLSFIGDDNTGIFHNINDQVKIKANGIDTVDFNTTFINNFVPLRFPRGTVSVPSLAINIDTDTGIYSAGAGILGLTCQGQDILNTSYDIPTSIGRISANYPIKSVSGTVGNPQYSFLGYPTTGMYNDGVHSLNFASAGVERLRINVNNITSSLPFVSSAGTSAFPGIAIGATNKGFYDSAANQITLSLNGVGGYWVYSPTLTITQRTLTVQSTNATSMIFNNTSGVAVGTITTNATNTAFNTASDVALKKNITPMNNGIEIVRLMKPCRYNWISDDSFLDSGFIAQEMNDVMPNAVKMPNVYQDINGNNKELPAMIDYTKIITPVVCSVKYLDKQVESLKLLVASLEARILALESV